MSTDKGFTGQYNDPVTGLDYYGARYYDPVVGQFTSADPVVGNDIGENPYQYVEGSPESFSDPSGLARESLCGNPGGICIQIPTPAPKPKGEFPPQPVPGPIGGGYPKTEPPLPGVPPWVKEWEDWMALSELKQHLAEKSRFCYADLIKTGLNKECRLMNCPHCAATTTRKRAKKTKLGYTTFFCAQCQCTFNERTGTPFNYLEFPTDIVLFVVLWRLRYKLSLRDIAELFLERGFVFTHETVRDWEARFASLIADQLRSKRHGHVGNCWHVDETYIKVQGKWCYLYRAIDSNGNLVDSMLSQKRNMDAAKRFFTQTLETAGSAPERVTTDGHGSYPRAIRETFGSDVLHRTSHYLNNILEQDHRGIKQRYYPMRGFGNFASASQFCRAFDEVRQFFRFRTTTGQSLSLAQQRDLFRQRLDTFHVLVLGA